MNVPIQLCPFCGSKAELCYGSSHADVSCANEDCGAEITVWDRTLLDRYVAGDIAIDRWNRRAQPRAKAQP